MNTFQLLIVEDDEGEISAWRETTTRYQEQIEDEGRGERKTEITVCENVPDALKQLNRSFDGAVIDLKLADQDDGGYQVIRHIREMRARIPIAILTGQSDPVDIDSVYIGVFKKTISGAGQEDILDRFWDIYNTGITRIVGGRGKIEDTLDQVFRTYLTKKKYQEKWIAYGKQYEMEDSSRTERALLRHTLNHLLRLIDEEEEFCFPEEFYLISPLIPEIRTGSIVWRKYGEKSGYKFVVMNPACDLVPREDKNQKSETKRPKAEKILLVEIESTENLLPKDIFINPSKKQQNKLKNVLRNNEYPYYHCLPSTNFFEGGLLNFRKLSTYSLEEFQSEFELFEFEISPSFVKDIVSRFSAYYARQGQPDIDHTPLLSIAGPRGSD